MKALFSIQIQDLLGQVSKLGKNNGWNRCSILIDFQVVIPNKDRFAVWNSDRQFSVSVSVSAEISVLVSILVSVSVWIDLSVSAETLVQNPTKSRNFLFLFPLSLNTELGRYFVYCKENSSSWQNWILFCIEKFIYIVWIYWVQLSLPIFTSIFTFWKNIDWKWGFFENLTISVLVSVSVSVCFIFPFRFRLRLKLNRNFGVSVSV
jgi:hypothetical protein